MKNNLTVPHSKVVAIGYMYANKNANIQRLELALLSASQLGLQFKGVTFLAKYCAQRMHEIRLSTGSKLQYDLPVVSYSVSAALSYKSLLKDSLYRSLLDAWMQEFKVQAKPSSESLAQIRSLQRALLQLRNSYERLNRDFNKIQQASSGLSNECIATPADQDGFIIAHSLIKYFSDFLEVRDGILIEKSPARPVIASRAVFSSYLIWLEKEISIS